MIGVLDAVRRQPNTVLDPADSPTLAGAERRIDGATLLQTGTRSRRELLDASAGGGRGAFLRLRSGNRADGTRARSYERKRAPREKHERDDDLGEGEALAGSGQRAAGGE